MVTEQLILETVSRHMNNKKVIRSSQYGFTKKKSCFNNLINFYHEVTGFINEEKAINSVYLGFTKAINAVFHKHS